MARFNPVFQADVAAPWSCLLQQLSQMQRANCWCARSFGATMTMLCASKGLPRAKLQAMSDVGRVQGAKVVLHTQPLGSEPSRNSICDPGK